MNMFSMQPNIYHGSDSLQYLKKLKAEKIFLVADKQVIHTHIAGKVINRLKEASIHVFSDIEGTPSLTAVKKGLASFLKEKPEVILALGDSGAIEAAKAILFFYHQMAISEKKKPLLITIPTVSGTGSEVTPYAAIINDDQRMPLQDEWMQPDVVVLEAELSASVPPEVTADMGMDLLTHAIESYVSPKATTFTSLFSEKAIQLVFTYLLRAYRFGEDLTARENVQLASCMAGMAYANSSLGINHGIAHAMEMKLPLSHGRSNAMLLPYMIEYNGGLCDGTIDTSEAAKKYGEIASLLGLPCATLEEGVRSLSTAVKLLNKKFNIPLTFQDAHIDKDLFEESIPLIAKEAMQDVCTAGNPKQVKEMDIIYLLKWAYTG